MSWKDWFFSALAILVLYNCNAQSAEVDFKYGLGFVDKKPSSQIKVFSFRVQDRISKGPILYAVESGVWGDVGHLPRKSSMFSQWQLGVRPESEHFYAQAFWGVAAISCPDSQLGGAFPQFAQDLGFGFKDKMSSIGLGWKHISSAGIYKPNKGRDFLQIVVGLEFD